MNYVKNLNELSCADVYRAGGKGANLGELKKIDKIGGILVPAGYCLLNSAFNEVLGSYLSKFDDIIRCYQDLAKASSEIGHIVLGMEIPPKISDEIFAACGSLANLIAVRSSSTGEDSEKNSFAGLGDTYLNVNKTGLIDSVKKCWASIYSERSLVYRRHKHLPNGSMAVILQNMVHPSKSGVMFTADPVSDDSGHILIEANWGYGESIVSGKVTPDSYLVEKASRKIAESSVGTKSLTCVKDGDCGTKNIPTPQGMMGKECLSNEELSGLVNLGMLIEDHFKKPQDIEWAIQDRIYITQSRPITTIGARF